MNIMLKNLLNCLFPPSCGGCGVELFGDSGLCPECWRRLNFIASPFCACCGIPFDAGLAGNEDFLCMACAARPPGYELARSALLYDEGSRPLILALKHGDRADLAPLLARLMMDKAEAALAGAGGLVPVPLHPFRLWQRRYNQAQLLCRALGKRTGIPVLPHLLRRVKATPTQGGLSRAERERNVRNAFVARNDAAGRNLVLVDDVLTTGATAASCTRALLDAGAASVRVLTAARVLQAHSLPL